MSVPEIFLHHIFTRKLFAFAGNTLLIYDYLLTLSLETSYVWYEPWTLVKSLFLINRYGNLIGQTFIMLEETGYLTHGSRHFCIIYQLACPFFSIFSGESIRFLVLIRACAISRCRRNIAFFVNVLYALYAIAIFVMKTCLVLLHANKLNFVYLDTVGICITYTKTTSFMWKLWFIVLFLDACVIAVVCWSLYQCNGGIRDIRSGLVRLLVLDGILFYLATLFNVIFSIICLTVYSKDPRNYLPMLITYPLLSVAGQRLILNLRKYRARSMQFSTRDLSVEVNRQIAAMDLDVELVELERDGKSSKCTDKPIGTAEVAYGQGN